MSFSIFTTQEASAAKREAGTVSLKLSTGIKEMELSTAPNGIGVASMADYIKETSGGKLYIEMFLDGVLGSTADEMIGGAQNGAFDMIALSFGNWGDYTKAFIPVSIPYLFSQEEILHQFIDGSIGDRMKTQVEKDTGMVVLALLDVGFRNITSNRLVKAPKDMKGLKIRTQTDRYQMAAIKELGAAPTSVSFAELYSGLQQGLVDAQENPIINTYQYKLYEVQKHMLLSRHNYTFTVLAISKDKLDSLAPEYRKIVLEGGRLAEKTARLELKKKETEALVALAKLINIYEPSKEEQLLFQSVAKKSWTIIKEDMGHTYFQDVINEVDRLEKMMK